ncbi:MAG: substrate-binding domain-containing protein [Candidatus Altiarchaeia archaeon]
MKLKNMLKSNKGMSEVVAVLILISVVIVGAVGAGVIMTTFSNQVADDASAEGIGENSATEISTAGSTTVFPVTDCMGKAFATKVKGVKVTAQGGGSGAGVAAAGMKIVDLGASSALDKITSGKTKYPDLEEHLIGGSGVVFIASTACTDAANVSKNALKACYNSSIGTDCKLQMLNGTDITPTIGNVYERSEDSGTEDTVAKYVGYQDGTTSQLKTLGSHGKSANGNQGILDAVKTATTCVIGFVDYGIAAGESNIIILNVENKKAEKENIKSTLKTMTDDKYPAGLARQLYYVSNGAPSSLAQKYIDFVNTPASAGEAQADCWEETGYIAAWEFA